MAVRRGAVFTLAAIFLSALLVSTYASQRSTDSSFVSSTTEGARISLMNAFTTTVEQQAEQSLAVIGFLTLQRMSEKVGGDGSFLAGELNTTVRGCILNNTIDMSPVEQCVNDTYLINNTLDLLSQLVLDELSITLTYTLNDAWVTEEVPLEVRFWLNFSYNISDPFASWVVEGVVVSSSVSVIGLEDPYYAYLRGNGLTTEYRNFSLAERRPSQFNSTVFDEFYDNRSYIVWQGSAPSVLQRYEGDTSPSLCCGIESVVRRANLTLAGGYDYGNFSFVDHHFIGHVLGALPPYDCTAGEVKKLRRDGPAGGTQHLGLEQFSFENPYNLTSSPDLNPDPCAWP